jgi:hypothetical protein
MLAFKPQTPVNHPEESIQHSEHGESLKSRIYQDVITPVYCSYQQKQKLLLHSAGFGLHEF